jgi:hypothetical protein
MYLHGLFDENWITLLTTGIDHNLLEPGEYSRIWDRTDNNRIVFYDSDNTWHSSQYRQFVYKSSCVFAATVLLDTDRLNLFLDVVFTHSPGVTFAIPSHQGEPYWWASGLDTVGGSKHHALLTPAGCRASMMLDTNPKTRLQDRH